MLGRRMLLRSLLTLVSRWLHELRPTPSSGVSAALG
jgi:hypothetical protein